MEKKELILFEDYKRGFSEVEKLVAEFEGISNGSQKVFLNERVRMLKEQQRSIQGIKVEALEEIRQILVTANSRISALLDMEKFIEDELKKCEQIREQIEGTDQ